MRDSPCGVVSLCVSRSVAGLRAGRRRGAGRQRCAWPPTSAWAFRSSMGCESTLIASRLAERLGVDAATASQTYYACLLSHAGCTTDAHVTAEVFGDSLTTHLHPVMYGSGREVLVGASPRAARARSGRRPVRAFQVARGLPRMAREQRPHLTAAARWQGCWPARSALPRRWRVFSPISRSAGTAGTAPPREGGGDPARRCGSCTSPMTPPSSICWVEWSAPRASSASARGTRSTPRSRPAWQTVPTEILALDEHESAWDETLAREPGPPLMLTGEGLDRALAAMGNFADLISPYLAGHSAGVAELATAAAATLPDRCGGYHHACGGRRWCTTSGGSRSGRGSGKSPGR